MTSLETKNETTKIEHLPDVVHARLNDYLARLDDAFPGQLGGLYLHGSVGQGGYNEHYSDLDMIAVLNVPLDEAGLDRLDQLHKDLQAAHGRWKLEVHYLQWGDLGREKKDIPPHPYYKTPQLSRAERHHIGPFYWWLLKYHGIALRGPQPAGLPFQADWEPVAEWSKNTFRNYWAKWIYQPRNLISLWGDEVAYWSVLGYARLYYNMRLRNVTTKEAAGKYVMAFAPARFESVLQEALRIRAGERGSYYANRLQRAVDIVRFMHYMTGECQRLIDSEL